jgi:hypothetical protein
MKTTPPSKSGRHPAVKSTSIAAAAWLSAGIIAHAQTPEQVYEGGTNTYANWIELSAGGFVEHGSEAQFQQRQRTSSDVFGGIEDLHYQQKIDKDTTLAVDGRGIYDNDDYKLSLALARSKLGFVRFSAENYQTWYNGNGGFFPPANLFFPLSDDALVLDRGEISFEVGLTLKDAPVVTFKYTHRYREGEKSSTAWGPIHPPGTLEDRALFPAFYDIDEKADIFELDVTHRIKKTDVGLGLVFETGDLNNAHKMTLFPNEPGDRKITDREASSYDTFNAHLFTETWIRTNLLFSSGYSYTYLNDDMSGDRIYGDDFDVVYVPNSTNGVGYNNLIGNATTHEGVLNLNLMSIPLPYFTIVPSLRVMGRNTDADVEGVATRSTFTQDFTGHANQEWLDVRERLDLRYSGITNWVFYSAGEWTEGQGDLEERGGIGSIGGVGVPTVHRDTDTTRFFQKYSLGARWYPTRHISLDAGGYFKMHSYDFDHTLDDTPNDPTSGNRYPAFLTMQDFQTYDGNVRLTWRVLPNLTLVSRYEYQFSTIHTRPDSVSGLPEVESSEMTSHIIAQNISWSPLSRLSLQVGVNYVLSEVETPVSDLVPAGLSAAPILTAQNNYWTLNFNSSFVLDEKTDLNLGYFYYRADNYNDNSQAGVPYGAGAEEHGITAGIMRRLTHNIRVGLKYAYFRYEDQLSGGNNDYDSHFIYSNLQYRF